MQLLSSLLVQGLTWPLFCLGAFSYSEDLFAAQLIGSHFGVTDAPLTFDYVVVGGGTAGLVMARRLAANASLSVAVIEAGGFYEFDNGNYSEIPAFAAQFTGMSDVLVEADWYLPRAQIYCLPQICGQIELMAPTCRGLRVDPEESID